MNSFVLNQKISQVAGVLFLMLLPAFSYATGFDPDPVFPSLLTTGSAGQLNRPNAITKDGSGNIYVSDVTNNRIQSFSNIGNPLSALGGTGPGIGGSVGAGTAIGEFFQPTGIAFDATNSVFVVSDSYNNRIQVLPPGGTAGSITAVGGFAFGTALSKAAGVDVDSAGNIFIADTYSNCRVQKYSSSGTFIGSWGSCANTNPTPLVFDFTDGKFGDGSIVSANPALKIPAGDIAVNKTTGDVYVTDLVLNRVQKFDNSGNFISKWGSFGTGNGQFNKPAGITLDSLGNVYVADILNNRVQKFNSNGSFIAALTGLPNPPQDVLVDSSFNLYVTGFDVVPLPPTQTTSWIKKFTPNFDLTINTPTNGTVTHTGGVSCGATCTTYGYGTVTLTATPDFGYYLSNWGGTCSSTTTTPTVTCVTLMNGDKTFTPVFSSLATYTLTTTKTGGGTITGSPAAVTGSINCGANCSATYYDGTAVTLTATPDSGYIFTGWNGSGCTGTGTCTVSMTAAKTVNATFVAGSGLTVTSTGGAVTGLYINCGTTCHANYISGTSVTLTATPASGYVFAGWSGACTNTSGTCTVVVGTSPVIVTAIFNPPQTLTITPQPSYGRVTGSLINCGTTTTACSASYTYGTVVTLTATADSNATFLGWSGGGCSGTASTCSVTMNAAKSVTADFAGGTRTLTISKTNGSNGRVTGSAINCGTTCTANYYYGTVVTLTATPIVSGKTFTGWSGACTNASGTCVVTMDAAKGVTAAFSP